MKRALSAKLRVGLSLRSSYHLDVDDEVLNGLGARDARRQNLGIDECLAH